MTNKLTLASRAAHHGRQAVIFLILSARLAYSFLSQAVRVTSQKHHRELLVSVAKPKGVLV
jgi:hypothetical protein